MSDAASSHSADSTDDRKSEDSIFEREPQRCTITSCEELLKPARSYTKVELRPHVWVRTYVWRSNCPRHGLLDEETGKMACPSGSTGGAYVKHIKLPTHARKRSVPSLIAHASTLYAPPPAPPPSLPLPMIPTTAPNGMPLAAPAGPPTPFPRSLAAPSVPPVPPLPIPYAYSSSAFLPAAPLAMPRYAPSAFVPPASSVHPYAAPGTMAARVPASTLPSAVPIKALPTPPRPPRPAGADGQPFAMPAANSHAQAI